MKFECSVYVATDRKFNDSFGLCCISICFELCFCIAWNTFAFHTSCKFLAFSFGLSIQNFMIIYNHNVLKSLVVYEVECFDCGALNFGETNTQASNKTLKNVMLI